MIQTCFSRNEMQQGGTSYQDLAPFFRSYSESRADYLEAVDKIVVESFPRGAASLLDVGAGDGVRALKIADSGNIERVVLVEPDLSMIGAGPALAGVEILNTAAEDLPAGKPEFEAITCLWNVLGHIETGEKRVIALKKMKSRLSEKGLIFVDVNNRYNASAYGWVKTFGRMFYDLVKPAETNGDVSYSWRVGGKTIQSRGHVFTPREMERLIGAAGLRVKNRFVIDYENGRRRRSVFRGQLLYLLTHR